MHMIEYFYQIILFSVLLHPLQNKQIQKLFLEVLNFKQLKSACF